MRVVIVGGGFGGIRAALKLANKANLDVQLISERSYFEYHAALYRAATGRSPLEVAIPLDNLFKHAKNVEVIEDRVISIDDKAKQLVGASNSHYHYDSLVLALGNVTQYFGIKGLDKYSYGIKSIHEALELKRHLHEELAEKPHGRTNYVVVGGGPSGVELAAELANYLDRIRQRHKLASKAYKITLVEAADRLMPMLPADFSARIAKRLKKLGVDLKLKTAVEGETFDHLKLPSGSVLTHSVIWTAGTANNPFFATHEHLFKLGRGQKVEVNMYLEGAPDIYVIGDAANTPYSGMAQTAVYDGEFVADSILRKNHGFRPRVYQPKQPVYIIPVGAHWSAASWHGLQFFGYFGWLVRRWADFRLYMKFMPLAKALSVWRHGYELAEACPECR